MVKHGVELADPRAEVAGMMARETLAGKSAEASVDNSLCRQQTKGNRGCILFGESDTPALPVTADTVQVVIRLSEKPGAKFTKDHISVTERDTWGDPVALVPQYLKIHEGFECILKHGVLADWIAANPIPATASLVRGLLMTTRGC